MAISLINSIIEVIPKRAPYKKKLVDFQRKFCPNIKEENIGKVSKGYFQNFLKIKSNKIESAAPLGLEEARN